MSAERRSGRRAVVAVSALAFFTMASIATSSAQPSSIDPAARSAIVGPTRAEAGKRLGRAVSLKITSLKREGAWAFLVSRMVDQTGEPIDLAGTRLEAAARAGMASRTFCALLRQEDGTWMVVASCLGVTDVAWSGWDQRYGAPAGIFLLEQTD